MPLYEVFCISSVLPEQKIHALIKATSKYILESNGVVSSIDNLGVIRLPYRMKSHGTIHSYGQYFTIQFHSSPKVPSLLINELLRKEENVIRSQTVKLGTSLPETVKYLKYKRAQESLKLSH